MCGIAGIFDLRERRPIDEALLVAMRDSIRHRGPDGEGLHVEPGVGLAHRQAFDHRRRRRAAAYLQRRRLGSARLQRRDLQLSGPRGRAALVRARLPHALRYRGRRSRLGGVGRGLRRAVQRHVRLRPLGSKPRQGVSRAGPDRDQAALLRRARERAGSLRIGAQGASGASRPRRAPSTPRRSRSSSPTATWRSREASFAASGNSLRGTRSRSRPAVHSSSAATGTWSSTAATAPRKRSSQTSSFCA